MIRYVFTCLSLFAVLLYLGACSHRTTITHENKSVVQDELSQYTEQDRAIFGPPLLYAVSSNNLAFAKALILQGHDVNAEDPVRKTPLIRAIEENNPAMLRLLLQHGAQPNRLEIGTDSCNTLLAQASFGDTRFYELPLDIARKKGNKTIIDLLIQSGAKSASDCFEQEYEEQRVFERESNKYFYE